MRAIVTLVLSFLAFGITVFSDAKLAPVSETVESPAFSSRPSSQIASYSEEWHKVVKIVDGDTIVISLNGKNETVRLIGVDTPETVDPRTTVQCFGNEASNEVKKILGAQYVRIEMDASQGERDKYGRLLAYVFAPLNSIREGLLLNEYLIESGFGHEYTYNLPYKYQKQFKAAEADARAQKKGLWADGACAPRAITPINVTPSTLSLPFASGEYECSRNTYNCSDFSKQNEAQHVFESCGGSANDIHLLDSDRDGRVCESLP